MDLNNENVEYKSAGKILNFQLYMIQKTFNNKIWICTIRWALQIQTHSVASDITPRTQLLELKMSDQHHKLTLFLIEV